MKSPAKKIVIKWGVGIILIASCVAIGTLAKRLIQDSQLVLTSVTLFLAVCQLLFAFMVLTSDQK